MSDTSKGNLEMNDTPKPTVQSRQLLKILPLSNVFSFLTITENLRCSRVSQRWNSSSILYLKKKKTLDLSEFWYKLGGGEVNAIQKLCTKFENVNTLSLAYCQLLTDSDVVAILTLITKKNEIKKLSLFYCNLLTDKVISHLARLTPKLEVLDLGHVHKLTNQSITMLSSFEHLHTLVLKNNSNYTEKIIVTAFNSFKTLKFLDLQRTSLDTESVNELREDRPEIEIIGPKNHNVTVNILKKDFIERDSSS